MKNLKEMSVEEISTLIDSCKEELLLRESQGNGYYKEFWVSGKAYRPCTYKQIQYAESLASKTNSSITSTSSQMMKRFESEEMSEAIDLMKEGKRIRIY